MFLMSGRPKNLKMMLQVHDELVFELPERLATDYGKLIQDEMSQAIKVDVPLVVDLDWGKSWLECK